MASSVECLSHDTLPLCGRDNVTRMRMVEGSVSLHFLPQFRTFPGAPEFKETLKEANAYYEKSIMWPGASVSQAGGWRI